MILYTSGCSFTYGEELKDKQNAWPHILGKKLQVDDIINTGVCSASNEYIQRNILEFVLSNQQKINNMFIVIGWTSDIRWEGYIEKPISTYVQLKSDRHVQYMRLDKTRIYTQNEIDAIISPFLQNEYNKLSRNFFSCFKNNKYFNYYNKLRQILLTHYFLEMFNIKHLFFNSLIEIYDKQKHDKLAETFKFIKNIQLLQEEFKNKLYYIQTPTMQEYVKKYPLAPKQHPLEKGHEMWGEYLYKYIQKNNML